MARIEILLYSCGVIPYQRPMHFNRILYIFSVSWCMELKGPTGKLRTERAFDIRSLSKFVISQSTVNMQTRLVWHTALQTWITRRTPRKRHVPPGEAQQRQKSKEYFTFHRFAGTCASCLLHVLLLLLSLASYCMIFTVMNTLAVCSTYMRITRASEKMTMSQQGKFRFWIPVDLACGYSRDCR